MNTENKFFVVCLVVLFTAIFILLLTGCSRGYHKTQEGLYVCDSDGKLYNEYTITNCEVK